MSVQSAGNQAMNQRAEDILSSTADRSPAAEGNQIRSIPTEAPATGLSKPMRSTYQLKAATIETMEKDVANITKTLQAVFPDRALIVSLLEKWAERDRELSSSVRHSPYGHSVRPPGNNQV